MAIRDPRNAGRNPSSITDSRLRELGEPPTSGRGVGIRERLSLLHWPVGPDALAGAAAGCAYPLVDAGFARRAAPICFSPGDRHLSPPAH